MNIGITHVFSSINICRVPRMLFEHEADRPSVHNHPRDPASVTAMKQTCVIVILAYFTLHILPCIFQVQTHVQTARESPDLNMDFSSFDNGCKQLYQ